MDYVIIRFLCAILTGSILSQTGSLIQMSTRNILASPSTLGFDGLSILWILIFHSFLLFFGFEQPVLMLFAFGVPIFILIGWIYSKAIGKFKNIERLILMGLTFNLLVGAIFSLWQFLFLAFNLPFPVELWFGHFRFANGESLLILGIVQGLIFLGWGLLKKELYLFSLGKNISTNFKLNHQALFAFLFMTVSLGTFTIISLFGAFSFLGLIFPILARKLWFQKFDLQGEFIFGSLMNGLFLMIIDSLCYYFPIYGAEVPVGLIATAVGAVSLIFLLWKSDTHLELLAKIQK
jgi:ABC-type Fe3+-siderophore transport system permease subunit